MITKPIHADVPLISDTELRQQVVFWLSAQAHAWELQADGFRAWDVQAQHDLAMAKAAVLRQAANDIKDAMTRYPEAWRQFVKKEQIQ